MDFLEILWNLEFNENFLWSDGGGDNQKFSIYSRSQTNTDKQHIICGGSGGGGSSVRHW